MAISADIEILERRWLENPTGLMFAPLAEAYRKGGDPERALEILATGLERHPDYVPALIVRGRCRLDTGDQPEAEATFRLALERDPVNAIALKGIAEVYERTGRLAEAAERLAFLLDVDRGDAEARLTLERLREVLRAGPSAPSEPPEVPWAEPGEPIFEPVAAGVEPAPADESADESATLVVEAEEPAASPPPPEPFPEEEALPDAASLEEAPPEETESAPAPAFEDSFPAGVMEPETVEAPGNWEAWSHWEPPPSPPAPQPEESEAAVEIAGDLSDEVSGPEAEPAEEPTLVVTESMAELFRRQGHRELALAVYRQLAERSTEAPHLREAVLALEGEIAAREAERAGPAEPPRRFAARETGGESVEAFLQAVLGVPPLSVQAPVLPPAIEPGPAGEPTRAGDGPFSLADVFEDRPAGPGQVASASPAPSAVPEATPEGPSYDEFFGTPVAGEPAGGAGGAGEGTGASPRAPDAEDLHQFNDWLRSLKR